MTRRVSAADWRYFHEKRGTWPAVSAWILTRAQELRAKNGGAFSHNEARFAAQDEARSKWAVVLNGRHLVRSDWDKRDTLPKISGVVVDESLNEVPLPPRVSKRAGSEAVSLPAAVGVPGARDLVVEGKKQRGDEAVTYRSLALAARGREASTRACMKWALSNRLFALNEIPADSVPAPEAVVYLHIAQSGDSELMELLRSAGRAVLGDSDESLDRRKDTAPYTAREIDYVLGSIMPVVAEGQVE